MIPLSKANDATETQTPRTDEEHFTLCDIGESGGVRPLDHLVKADFARTLERELITANAKLASAEMVVEAAKELSENVRLGYGGPNTKACRNRLNEALDAHERNSDS